MKYFLGFVLMISCLKVNAQSNALEKLYYHNPKGITFIPPLTRPALVYQGKLYAGNKQLAELFKQLNHPQLNLFFKKYKTKRAIGTGFTIIGSILPILSLIETRETGNINWWMLGGAFVANTTGRIFHLSAQNQLLGAAAYYGQVTGTSARTFSNPNSIGITLPLGK